MQTTPNTVSPSLRVLSFPASPKRDTTQRERQLLASVRVLAENHSEAVEMLASIADDLAGDYCPKAARRAATKKIARAKRELERLKGGR